LVNAGLLLALPSPSDDDADPGLARLVSIGTLCVMFCLQGFLAARIMGIFINQFWPVHCPASIRVVRDTPVKRVWMWMNEIICWTNCLAVLGFLWRAFLFDGWSEFAETRIIPCTFQLYTALLL
jgi:hypothetical protein